MTPSDVLAFWREAGPDRWYERDDAFDAAIRTRFLSTCDAAVRGENEGGRVHPECRPHSILPMPCHRPLRGSAPAAGFAVHGAHPIDG